MQITINFDLGNMTTHELVKLISDASAILAQRLGQTESSLTFEEKDFVAKSDNVSAIKAVRSRTGLGLRDSKDRVDAYRRSLPKKPRITGVTLRQ